jgi:hypothetical protein
LYIQLKIAFHLWIAPVRDTIKQRTGKASMQPKSEGFLRVFTYVNDVTGSAQFDEKIFGFRLISDFGERGWQ